MTNGFVVQIIRDWGVSYWDSTGQKWPCWHCCEQYAQCACTAQGESGGPWLTWYGQTESEVVEGWGWKPSSGLSSTAQLFLGRSEMALLIWAGWEGRHGLQALRALIVFSYANHAHLGSHTVLMNQELNLNSGLGPHSPLLSYVVGGSISNPISCCSWYRAP